MVLDDVYDELLAIVSEVAARIDVPIESERFFSRLVESFQGSRGELIEYVGKNVRRWFRSLGADPRWIQDADWQFSNAGKPMIFIGQVDLPADAGLFHDDASVFVFLDPDTSEVKTVTQVA